MTPHTPPARLITMARTRTHVAPMTSIQDVVNDLATYWAGCDVQAVRSRPGCYRVSITDHYENEPHTITFEIRVGSPDHDA